MPVPAAVITPSRIYGLDVLRAFAILSVMFAHAAIYVPAAYRPYHEWLAFDGVSIFFVLSGFLIGGILLRTLEKQPATPVVLLHFWQKRWLRTVPPYFLVLTLVCLLDALHYTYVSPEFKPGTVWKFYFFLQNLRSPHPIFFQEAWSLSIEEWFYLLVPTGVFLLVASRLPPRRAVVVIALALLLGVTAYRYYKYLHFPPATSLAWDQNFRKIVITRLDSLMYGVLGAYWWRYHPASWNRHKGAKLVVGLALMLWGKTGVGASALGVYACVFSFSLFSFATLLLLPYASQAATGSGWVYRALTHISLISYSMYLLNATVFNIHVIEPALQAIQLPSAWAGIAGYVSFWLLTIGAATLMYRYFEVPVMALKRYIKPLPTSEPQKASA